MTLDIEARLEPAHGPRHRQAVLQGKSSAGRGTEMVGKHPPFAIGAPAKIKRHEVEMSPSRRLQPVQRAEEIRAAGHQHGGDMPFADETTRTVKIGEYRFQQVRPLRHAGGDRLPFGLFQKERNRRERPRALLAIAYDAEAGADIVGMAPCTFAYQAPIVATYRRQFFEQRSPCGVLAFGAQHIAGSGMGAIIGHPAIGDGRSVEQRRGTAGQERFPKWAEYVRDAGKQVGWQQGIGAKGRGLHADKHHKVVGRVRSR